MASDGPVVQMHVTTQANHGPKADSNLKLVLCRVLRIEVVVASSNEAFQYFVEIW